MYRRPNSNNQPTKNQNTGSKSTDSRKEIEAEEKEGKKAPGEKLIDIMLKTGNENCCQGTFSKSKRSGRR